MSSPSSSTKALSGPKPHVENLGFWQRIMLLPQSLMRTAVLVAAAILSWLIITLFGGPLSSIEERVGAMGWTLFPDASLEERIALVVIDEPSLAEIGPWPWSRVQMSRLVSAIDRAGAQLQLHDIVYPEPRSGDEEFLASLQDAAGAVIAQVPILSKQINGSSSGVMTHALEGVSCSEDSASISLASAGTFLGAATNFKAVPKGHNAALIDSDGAVRRSPAVVCVDDAVYPALSIAAFLQLSGSGEWRGEITPGSSLFGPEYTLTLPGYPGFEIPLDSNGVMRISFAKAPLAFQALSAADVINDRIDPTILKNAWVIVGGTAFGMADIVPTPYSGAAFGVELQARLLTSMLDMSIPFTPSGASLLLSLNCLVFAVALYLLAGRGDRVTALSLPAAVLILPTLAASMHVWALMASNLWLGWMAPALFGLLGASGLLLLELGRVRLERARVFSNLNSYLPIDVAREIAFALPSSSVNARRSDATLLSADLRNFSAFGEARPPEEIAALLHFFFTRVTEIVEEKSGRIQEFRGDGILASWDTAGCVAARKALQAAQAMQESLNDRLLPPGALNGLEPLALGVGIEQGPVLIGSLGPAHRRSYTMLGDTVSITLRIQEMTAELAQPILLGECVARQLSDAELQSQGSYLLAGLRIPHTLFAPLKPSQASAAPNSLGKSEITPNLTVLSGGKSRSA